MTVDTPFLLYNKCGAIIHEKSVDINKTVSTGREDINVQSRRKESMRVNEVGTFGICLDAHTTDTFEGRMYVSVFKEARPFKSIHGLIAEMSKALETAGVPHPFFEYRTFADKQDADKKDKKDELPKPHYDHGGYSGEVATFLVNILYRQNASWQGTVTWVESDKTANFRSALELFVLIESALK